jgi:hypothetical protein
VASRIVPGAPHEVLLVLDATTGQNAVSQAKKFTESVGLTGLFLAKLDGTAKGGVVVAIWNEVKVPVKYVGVGEGIDDILRFDPETFVDALFPEDLMEDGDAGTASRPRSRGIARGGPRAYSMAHTLNMKLAPLAIPKPMAPAPPPRSCQSWR